MMVPEVIIQVGWDKLVKMFWKSQQPKPDPFMIKLGDLNQHPTKWGLV